MIVSVLANCLTLLAMAQEPNFFGDFHRRSAAATAAELDAAANLPTAAFDEIAPSVLEIMKAARPRALRTRAMDVYCATAGPAQAEALIQYVNECLDGIAADADMGHRQTYRNYRVVSAFVYGDVTNWGQGMRGSAATVALFRRIATFTDYHFNATIYQFAVESLVEILPSDAARKQALLDIINDLGLQTTRRVQGLLSDPQSRQALRQIADGPEVNYAAVKLLSHFGDTESIPIFRRQRDELAARGDKTMVHFLEQSIKRIELQHPPTRLIDYLRSPDDDGFTQRWALFRTRELNLDVDQLRAAVLDWAAGAPPGEVGGLKPYAVGAGILRETDVPDAPPSLARRFASHSPPKRRTSPVPVPDRRPRPPQWHPNEANYEALGEWFQSVIWEEVPEPEASEMLHQKMCQLELLHPDGCGGLTESGQ